MYITMGWPFLIGMLVVIGAIIRIFVAWAIQYQPDSDHGVVFLMAKHMAEGLGFPVFFYGQPYMGSMEPAVSAIMFRLFGESPFVACLGTAFVGTICLLLIYLWGSGAGGRRAGLFALLLCIIGSSVNLHYSAAPRGGYMTMMACGVLTVWLSAGITTRLSQNRSVSFFMYVWLGLAAGLGWWSNQLVVAFLITAAVILLAGFRWIMARKGLLPAITAFFVGSAPWWIWNACNDWATFDFGGSIGNVAVTTGIPSLGRAFLSFMDLNLNQNKLDVVFLAILVVMVMLFLFFFIRDKVRGERSDLFFFQLAAPVFVLALSFVCVTSRYIMYEGNSRYLLPVLPALAVMLGVSADRLLLKWRFPVGWIVMILLVLPHVSALPQMSRDQAGNYQTWRKAARLADAVGSQCDGVCIGGYDIHWINFASGEKLCVACLPWERYAPYNRRAELAEHPAFLNDYCGLRAFLAYTGGRSRKMTVDDITADYDLTPPSEDWCYVDAQSVSKALDGKGGSCREILTDGVMDTSWAVALKHQETADLLFEFDRPLMLNGIRFVSSDNRPPCNIEADGRTTDGADWQPLLLPVAATGYFWSGPCVKLEGLQVFLEVRFSAPTGGVSRLRLKFGNNDSRPQHIRLDEILFMEQAPPVLKPAPSVEECLAALKGKDVKQFFGPRWMTERVACSVGNSVITKEPSFVSRSIQDLPQRDDSSAPEVFFNETTGLLIDGRDAVRSREVLRRCGHKWEEVLLGSHILLVVSAESANNWMRYVPVYWTEQGCFAPAMGRFAKRHAHLLFLQAMKQKKAGDPAGMLNSLKEAVRLYPWHQPAGRELGLALESAGFRDESVAQTAWLSSQTVPGIAGHIRFANGIEFLGLTFPAGERVPGQTMEITYFWKCPPGIKAASLAVFAHFENGKERFQDDHVLLENVYPDNLRYQPFPEIFSYTRKVIVPVSTSDGDYRIVMGLFDRASNKRFKATTDLKQQHRAVELPAMLTVKQW